MQLNKFIAHSGIASRRKAAEFIKQGLVTVNGTIIIEPGYNVEASDVVKLKNKKQVVTQNQIYILINKPKGYITSTADEFDRDTILDLIDKSLKKYRLYPIGRLDRETTGLLLITNDGDFANKMSHPRYEIGKTYVATLERPLAALDYESIKNGISLDDGIATVDTLMYLNQGKTRLKINLHSGKNRIIRRIFAKLGYRIIKLDRVCFADLTKKGLSVGRWRFLTAKEVKQLKNPN